MVLFGFYDIVTKLYSIPMVAVNMDDVKRKVLLALKTHPDSPDLKPVVYAHFDEETGEFVHFKVDNKGIFSLSETVICPLDFVLGDNSGK